MSREPKSWREAAGLSQAAVARKVGIGGQNPARTYARYESGASVAPTAVIARLGYLSHGAVEANDWHRVRLHYLKAHGQTLPAPRQASGRDPSLRGRRRPGLRLLPRGPAGEHSGAKPCGAKP